MPSKTTKDGRTILTGMNYKNFRFGIYTYQGGHCDNPECDIEGGRHTRLDDPIEWDTSFHLNHLFGRGAGKRDDGLFRDRKQMVRGECGKCHRVGHGQQEKVPSKLHWSQHA